MTMKIEKSGWKVTVDPGRYFVGDPCYTMRRPEWTALTESSGRFQTWPIGQVSGHDVLAFRTAFGDGLYRDQEGNEYSVDSGLIGLVDLNMVGDPEAIRLLPGYGRLVEFTEPTLCSEDGNGVLQFGPVVINTAAHDEEGCDDQD